MDDNNAPQAPQNPTENKNHVPIYKKGDKIEVAMRGRAAEDYEVVTATVVRPTGDFGTYSVRLPGTGEVVTVRIPILN